MSDIITHLILTKFLTAQKGHSEPLSVASDNALFCPLLTLISLDFFTTSGPGPKTPGNSALLAGELAPVRGCAGGPTPADRSVPDTKTRRLFRPHAALIIQPCGADIGMS